MATKPINIPWIRKVLNQGTEKLSIASYNRQFSTNIKIKIIKLLPALLSRANKTDFNLIFFHLHLWKAFYNMMR